MYSWFKPIVDVNAVDNKGTWYGAPTVLCGLLTFKVLFIVIIHVYQKKGVGRLGRLA